MVTNRVIVRKYQDFCYKSLSGPSKIKTPMKTIIYSLIIGLYFTSCYAQDFVSIAGNEINYQIKGSGEPWIVLVNGSGLDMNSLDTIYEALSKITTVLRYSRAGLGRSNFPTQAKDFDTMMSELELLIKKLNVPEPFILGGHSFGGLIIKAIAGKNPTSVAGLLSMDPSFEDNWDVLEAFDPGIRSDYQVPLDYIIENYPDRGFTHEFKTMVEVYNTPEKWETWFNYPSYIPHFVITSLKTTDEENSPGRGSVEIMNARAEAQYRAISHSDIHMQIRISDAGHLIYNDQPQLVIDSFRMLYNLASKSVK